MADKELKDGEEGEGEEEIGWIDHELHQRQDFVLDQDRQLFEYHNQMEVTEEEEDSDVVYRRAAFGSTLVTSSSHFDSMMTENFYEHQAPKISFDTSTASINTIICSPHIFQQSTTKSSSSTTTTSSSSSSSTSSLPPPVIDDDQVMYHQVHPTFESNVNAFLTLQMLQNVLVSNEIELTNDLLSSGSICWHLNACGLISAEEIYFTVQLKRLLSTVESPIRVDFHLRQGDEQLFLQLTDKIRFDCRKIDKEIQNLPPMSHGLFHPTKQKEEIDYTGSMDISDLEEFEFLLTELEMELKGATNKRNCFYLVKQFKDICQSKANRYVLVSNEKLCTKLIQVVQCMVQPQHEEDIVRFGLFILVQFFDTGIGNSSSSSSSSTEEEPIQLLNGLVNGFGGKKQLEFFLEQLLENNCQWKKCTKKIAHQLFQSLKLK